MIPLPFSFFCKPAAPKLSPAVTCSIDAEKLLAPAAFFYLGKLLARKLAPMATRAIKTKKNAGAGGRMVDYQ